MKARRSVNRAWACQAPRASFYFSRVVCASRKFPSSRMSREEALKSMTIWSAYAGFMEKDVGSLEPGKYADFVVLDQDIMRVPAELVLKTQVLSTWLSGKPVYEKKK